MEQINFSDVDARMDELFSEGISKEIANRIIYRVEPITKPITEMEVKGSANVNFCTYEVRSKIRNLFINNSFPSDRTIGEGLYDDIIKFLLGDSIPNEEKQIVAEHLTDEIKEQIFDEFYKRARGTNKCFYKDGIDFNEEGKKIECIYFNPRINGVPLKDSENQKIDITSERLFEIIKSGEMPRDALEIVALKSFLESDNFFDMPWCADKIHALKEQLQEDKIKAYMDAYLKLIDSEKVEAIASCNLIDHSINMNQRLRENLLANVPEEFTQMEKSMYLYIKLCQTFSYDDVYTLNPKTPTKGEVSNVAEYDEDNNKVVCYEFAYIYSELLRSIGIAHIREKAPSMGRFNNSHAYIEFLTDNIPIFADSTTSVESGDLFNAKSYGKLNGFRCQLLDQDAQKEFRSSLKKVYGYIKEQDKTEKMVPTEEEIKSLDIVGKFKLFNQCVENCGFKDMDLLSYIQKLKLTIFTPEELMNNANINFVNMNCKVFFNNASLKVIPENTMGYVIDLHTKQITSDNIKRKNNLLESAIDATEHQTTIGEINAEAGRVKRLTLQRENLDKDKTE